MMEEGALSYRMREKWPEGGMRMGMVNTTGRVELELPLGRAHYMDLSLNRSCVKHVAFIG